MCNFSIFTEMGVFSYAANITQNILHKQPINLEKVKLKQSAVIKLKPSSYNSKLTDLTSTMFWPFSVNLIVLVSTPMNFTLIASIIRTLVHVIAIAATISWK